MKDCCGGTYSKGRSVFVGYHLRQSYSVLAELRFAIKGY